MGENRSIHCNSSRDIYLLNKLCLNSSTWNIECVPNNVDDEKTTKDNQVEHVLIIVVGVWCVLIAIFGIFGNLLTLYSLPHAKKNSIGGKCWSKTWNTSTVFIINLARIDLFFCVFCIPTFAIPFLTQNWKYGHIPCRRNHRLLND